MVFEIASFLGRIVLGISTLSAGISTARALQAASPIPWEGNIVVTSLTPACSFGHLGLNDFLTVVYRPKFSHATYNKNTAPEGLSIFDNERSAILILANNATGLLRGTNLAVVSIRFDGRARLSNWSTSTITMTTAPTTIAALTKVIYLNGSISSYRNVPGCTLGFEGSLIQRPD